MDGLANDILEQFRQAASREFPRPSPEVWLEALRRLVAARAAPGTAALQAAMAPDLTQLARTAKFVMADEGPRVEAASSGDRALTILRRGGLWIRGGDVEAELLQLLGELGS